MKRMIILASLLCLLVCPAEALDLTAPAVPESGTEHMPSQTQDFGEALMEILGDAVARFRPDLKEAAVSCAGVLAGCVALSLLSSFPGHRKGAAELAGVLMTAGILLRATHSMVSLGMETVAEISEYGKLLLPVMAASLAAQGGVTSATAIFTGTAVFDALLCALISRAMVPLVCLFLALAVGCSALEEPTLRKLRDSIRGIVTWCLKTILYVYTGYISVTGVVSGATDAGILKAAKLTISGAVPVVGGILSDASEAILVSAGTVKNAAGIYGLLAVLAVWIGPFLRIGAHYLVLKTLGLICGAFGIKSVTELVKDFSAAMGLLLAMTGAVCLMVIISTVCFMRGVGI